MDAVKATCLSERHAGFAHLRSATWLEAGAYLGALTLFTLVVAQILLGQLRAANAEEQLPDMQLWSEERKAQYFAAVEAGGETLLGRLSIASVNLQAPIYASANDLNLNRGAGVIDGMAYPHEGGHIGIAGHRDGYFRHLKDLQLGDPIVLATIHGERRFAVTTLQIIDPEDMHHLQETSGDQLTLLTCYPFYYSGPAPQRFLVQATPLNNP